ncbi:MAG: HlyD family secretion protein [bacterium]
MIRWFLTLVSAAGIVLAVFVVLELRKSPPPGQPRNPPPMPVVDQLPIKSPVSATGVIEARSENISIGTNLPGVVAEVMVKVDDIVEPGQPLFRLDERQARAELKAAEAKLAVTQAQLERFKNAPRKEDLPPAEALVKETSARLSEAESAWARAQRLLERGSISQSDYDRDRYAYSVAVATKDKAVAELAKLKAGSWDKEITIAEAEVLSGKAMVEAAAVTLERHTAKALAPGRVLQVKIRPGEFAGQNTNNPLIILGDTGTLHVRVDIDEQDLDRFDAKAKAYAYLRGRSEPVYHLTPYRVEPFVVPKRNLTGENSERIDTRVLQVIYSMPENVKSGDLFVGQQMDVFIEARAFDATKSRFEPQKKVDAAATEPTDKARPRAS